MMHIDTIDIKVKLCTSGYSYATSPCILLDIIYDDINCDCDQPCRYFEIHTDYGCSCWRERAKGVS